MAQENAGIYQLKNKSKWQSERVLKLLWDRLIAPYQVRTISIPSPYQVRTKSEKFWSGCGVGKALIEVEMAGGFWGGVSVNLANLGEGVFCEGEFG